MARALETDPINQLEENLQCSVCLNILTDPRTLPCCHSFCKVCLERTVETCRGEAPRGQPIRRFPCPYCRTTFILDPDKHVADMPRNHFICNMVKVAAVLDRRIGVPCSHDCSQSYSVARCVTCEKFLCQECLTAHNNDRSNNGHSVLTMEELSKPENRKKINDKTYCNEHLGEKLKVYCESCDQLICRDCMDFKHVKEGHSCFLVKDYSNNITELLASNEKAMEKALAKEKVICQQLMLTAKQLDRDADNVKNEIIQRKEFVAKKVLEMLNQRAESLCREVDEIHKGKRASLDRQTEETKLYIENIKTSVGLSKKLINQGTEEEIISSYKMMLDNTNYFLTDREVPKPVAKLSYNSFTGKEPITEEIKRGLVNSLGEVHKEKKDTDREVPNPVAKLSYNSSTGKEPITEEIKRGLVNSLGEVHEEKKDTGKKLLTGNRRKILCKSRDSIQIKHGRTVTPYSSTGPENLTTLNFIDLGSPLNDKTYPQRKKLLISPRLPRLISIDHQASVKNQQKTTSRPSTARSTGRKWFSAPSDQFESGLNDKTDYRRSSQSCHKTPTISKPVNDEVSNKSKLHFPRDPDLISLARQNKLAFGEQRQKAANSSVSSESDTSEY